MRECERPSSITHTMRIVTWNVNGIRAAIRKGIDRFFESVDADVWLLQEVRCLPEQLPKDWQVPDGFEMIWHPAEKKGYSGVATLSRVGMEEIGRGNPSTLDANDLEGRILVTKHEDIRPSLEPSHAFSVAISEAKKFSKSTIVVVNSCGDAYKDRKILKKRLGISL